MSTTRECVDRDHWALGRCRPDRCAHRSTLLMADQTSVLAMAERDSVESVWLAHEIRWTVMVVELCESTSDGELRRVIAGLLPSWRGTDAVVLLTAAQGVLRL